MSTRAPLDGVLVRDRLGPGSRWHDVVVTPVTASTNADVSALARTGAPEGVVRATDHQTAGRGRLTRSWESPPRAGLAVSVLLRPTAVPRARWSWLPLLTGVAVARAVERTGLHPALKWPNDLLVDGRKAAGILVEAADDAVVLGIGLNVLNERAELPDDRATSLVLAGGSRLDRVEVLVDLLTSLDDLYTAWVEARGDPAGLRRSYERRCVTLGSAVRVDLPGGRVVTGVARAVDDAGALVVETADGRETLGAGDVVHVRPAGAAEAAE